MYVLYKGGPKVPVFSWFNGLKLAILFSFALLSHIENISILSRDKHTTNSRGSRQQSNLLTRNWDTLNTYRLPASEYKLNVNMVDIILHNDNKLNYNKGK